MKKNYLLLIASMLLSSIIIWGQAPQKIDFQAMARDGSGNPLLHQTIGVRISVIQGSTTVYTERHTPQTDDYGLFNLHIGDGAYLSGNFSTIDWGMGNHSVKVEIDPNGAHAYVDMGTSQLTSTPYAFYGEDEDADPGNEYQELYLAGNDLFITDGNMVTLPGGLWQQNDDDIYYSTGNVGIGILDPLVKLHVIEENSAGVLGSDLGTMSWQSDYISPAVFGWTENNTCTHSYGVFGHSYSTGSEFNIGLYGEAGGGTNNCYGVFARAFGQAGSYYSTAVFGSDAGEANYNYAGFFSGDVTVYGTFTNSGSSFKIDHPEDPANKYLAHSSVVSPDMMNVYNGNVLTDDNGLAVVEMPSYFEALNIDFRYQLTVIGEFAQAIVKEEISDNSFTIQTDKPNVKVSWLVTGVRNDVWAKSHRLVPEEDKKSIEKGRYIYPELFGKSKDMRMPILNPND